MNDNLNENRFYVYALLDTRKPGQYSYREYSFEFEPFYIGKGTRNRCKEHFSNNTRKTDTNKFKQRIINKIKD